MMKNWKVKREEGFTLVELMIVVAIIGILAAVAIPQFALYRIKGFNSSALSDVRNVTTSQSAFFADWQVFGLTRDVALPGAEAALAAAAEGTIIRGGSIVNQSIIASFAQAGARGVQIGVGNGVDLVTACAANYRSFNALAKHLQGDTYWATDSDATNFYWGQESPAVGTAVAIGDIPASAINADEFDGIAVGIGTVAGNWLLK